MKTPQTILQVYITWAFLLGFLDLIFPGAPVLIYVKFLTTCSLFLTALAIRKKYLEQYLITAACFWAALADYFFLLAKTSELKAQLWQLLGASSFLIAYLILSYGFHKGQPQKAEGMTALVLLLALSPTITQLAPVFKSYPAYFYLGACFFATTLLFFAWTAWGTLFRGYFTPSCARRIALAGGLIFLSDLAVAHAVFNPAYSSHFTPWLSCLIWITYIPAWALLVTVTAASRLYR